MTQEPASNELIGTTFAEHYEIRSVLDAGGLSLIYKAIDTTGNLPVAIKLLLSRIHWLEIFTDRFEKSAAKISRINHPNLVKLHDFGITADERPYVITEYTEGRSLFNILNRQGRLEIERALDIFIQLCDGLDALHANDIVHKDLRPNNMMIGLDQHGKEHITIVDLGLAKSLIKDGQELEVLRAAEENSARIAAMYLSPEQCTGTAVDARSDIYALGCIMYEALTGLPPFMNKNPFEIVKMHIDDEPRPLRMSRNDLDFALALDLLVLKTLRKSPIQRQQSMKDLKDDLIHVKSVIIEANRSSEHNLRSEGATRTQKTNTSANLIFARISLLTPIILGLLVLGSSAYLGFYLSNHSMLANQTPASPQQVGQEMSEAIRESLWQELDTAGQKAFEQGDCVEAETIYLKALKVAELLGTDDRRLPITLRKLQDVYITQHKYAEADKMEVRIRDILSKKDKQ